MSDRQSPNEPSYDWLYAEGASREPPGAQSGVDRSSEGVDSEPEPTRVLEETSAPAAQEVVADRADRSDRPGQQPSFGGVFPAPSRTQPRPQPRATIPSTGDGGGNQAPPPGPPPAKSAPSAAAPRSRRRRWIVRGVLILVVVWIAFLILTPIWAWSRITKVDAEPSGKRPAELSGTTYLLVGSDSREGLSKKQNRRYGTGGVAAEAGRTDTIILMYIPHDSGPTLMLSIPRDSYVEIPKHGMNKINAAFAIGGPNLLVSTVEHATHVRIDNYIEVGFAGFVDVVNAVGGITVCPTESINDPKAGNLKMSAGCHHVDGTTALDYSRSRAFALGDIIRAEHQREVISAVGKKAVSWKTILFPWRYFAINKAAVKSVTIGENVGPFDLVKFAWAMAHSSGSDAKRCVVPYSSLGTETSAGSSVIWNKRAAHAIFKDIRNDDTSAISCSATGQ